MRRTTMLVLAVVVLGAAQDEAPLAPAPADPAAAGLGAGLDPTRKQLLLDIVAAQRAVHTVQGRYTQTTRRADEPDGDTTVYKAVFVLEAPDHYSVTMTKPGVDGWRERFASDGKKKVHLAQIDPSIDPDIVSEPVQSGDRDVFRQILNFIQLQDPQAVKDFAFAPEATADGARLTLTPRGGQAAQEVTAIVIELDREYRTRRIRFDDPQGNTVEVAIDEATYNQPVPAGAFVQPGQ